MSLLWLVPSCSPMSIATRWLKIATTSYSSREPRLPLLTQVPGSFGRIDEIPRLRRLRWPAFYLGKCSTSVSAVRPKYTTRLPKNETIYPAQPAAFTFVQNPE